MHQQSNFTHTDNSYVYYFQQAQTNLVALIKEERLQKRIRKSKQKTGRTYD